MISHIRTSKANRELVTKLTNKFNLGTENVIARIALGYSLSQERKLELKDLKNAGGKEYSRSVFFGENYNLYTGMVSVLYGLHMEDPDLPKYLKLHLDEGLVLLNTRLEDQPSLDGYEFLINLIVEQMKTAS